MFQVLIESVRNGDPELALAAIDFWDRFIMVEGVVYKDEFKKKMFEQLLPLMLEQCKLKAEDFEKFKKDQMVAQEVLQRKMKITRMTIRSKAAKTIEKISSKFQTEVFFALRN